MTTDISDYDFDFRVRLDQLIAENIQSGVTIDQIRNTLKEYANDLEDPYSSLSRMCNEATR